MQALTLAFLRAQRISRQSQQLTRLAEKKLRQSHEKVGLHLVLGSVLGQRLAEFRSQGVTLRHQMQPVDIIVDPGLLVGLIDAAVDWAAERGRRLNIHLGIKNWPEHGKLVIRLTFSAKASRWRAIGCCSFRPRITCEWRSRHWRWRLSQSMKSPHRWATPSLLVGRVGLEPTTKGL